MCGVFKMADVKYLRQGVNQTCYTNIKKDHHIAFTLEDSFLI